MKSYVFHLVDDDFDLHFVPHSEEAGAAIKRRAQAANKSVRDYLLNQTALMLMIGFDSEEEQKAQASEQSCPQNF